MVIVIIVNIFPLKTVMQVLCVSLAVWQVIGRKVIFNLLKLLFWLCTVNFTTATYFSSLNSQTDIVGKVPMLGQACPYIQQYIQYLSRFFYLFACLLCKDT